MKEGINIWFDKFQNNNSEMKPNLNGLSEEEMKSKWEILRNQE
jgi:hypothetical protein